MISLRRPSSVKDVRDVPQSLQTHGIKDHLGRSPSMDLVTDTVRPVLEGHQDNGTFVSGHIVRVITDTGSFSVRLVIEEDIQVTTVP